jgi:hypothetical protein
VKKNHRVIYSSYIFGILFILLEGSGTQLSVGQFRQYNRIMTYLDLQAVYEASNNHAHAAHAYGATKGWFSCDHMCQRNKKRMEHAEAVLEDIRPEGYARMSDAIHSFWQYCYGARYAAAENFQWFLSWRCCSFQCMKTMTD